MTRIIFACWYRDGGPGRRTLAEGFEWGFERGRAFEGLSTAARRGRLSEGPPKWTDLYQNPLGVNLTKVCERRGGEGIVTRAANSGGRSWMGFWERSSVRRSGSLASDRGASSK